MARKSAPRPSAAAGPSAAEVANARKVVAGYKASDFERPSVTCDLAIISPRNGRLEVLLIQRGKPPFQGFWATPGGFLEMDEDLPDGARRELQEETGITLPVRIEQFGIYGKPGRDPRTRVITVAYLALLSPAQLATAKASDDARAVGWFGVERKQRPKMAFDHDTLLDDALVHVRRSIMHTALASNLLPKEFTARQLADVYAVLMGKPQAAGPLRTTLSRNGVLKAAKSRGKWSFNAVYQD
ncbi:MAG: NUDIX domain-containing protein [Planctomycetota bacterium]